MRKILVVFSAAWLGVALFSSASLAQRSGPSKAGKFQTTLVTAYDACVASNDTTTGSLPLPACHPAVPSDGQCTISSSGGGKAAAKVDPAGDVALKIKLKGIEGCDGETLQGQATLRVTTNQCASLDADGCTVSDLTHFPVTSGGNCVIDKGQCQIKTTVNTEIGAGTLSAGHNTSIELGGIFLKRQTGANDPGDVATSGLVVP